MLLKLRLQHTLSCYGMLLLFTLTVSVKVHAALGLSAKKVEADLTTKIQHASGDPTYVVLTYSQEKLHRGNFKSQSEWIRSLRIAESIAAAHRGGFYVRFCVETAKKLRAHSLNNEAYFFLYKVNNPNRINTCRNKKTRYHLHEELGLLYYYFKRFSESGVQLHQARLFASNDYERISLYNTIGLIHREQGNTDSSRIYFEKSLALAKKLAHKPWVAVISGNLGEYYWKKGQIEKARLLCERDYQFSMETGQEGSAFNALCLLLQMDLKEGKIQSAEQKQKVLDEMVQTQQGIAEFRSYYRAKTVFQEATGDYKGALDSYRKALLYNDTLRERSDIEMIKKTEFQIDFERKQAEISLLQEKKKNNEIVIYGLILLTTLIISIFIVFLKMLVKRRRREQEIAVLKQQQISRELEETEREMRSMLSNLIEKNELIERMSAEINQFHSNTPEIPEEKLKLLEKLQSFTLLTDDSWLEFKNLFERLNPNFFARLWEHAQDLTNAEIRLVTLIKLNLSNLEMARALGISPDSVRKTSLRLRKKLNIELHEELVRFILSL